VCKRDRAAGRGLLQFHRLGDDELEDVGHRAVELVAVDDRYPMFASEILDVEAKLPDRRETRLVAVERP
jgi:hypothetical protein